MLARWALAFALPLGGCAAPGRTDSTTAPVTPEAPAKTYDGTWSRIADEPRVGRYVSSSWGFSTVSYWIEGDDGVVLVDTQFLPSAAEEFLEIAERETGKPVVTAIVLHANPDKFNGTATLQARGIEVLTSAQVLALIPEVHEKRVAAFGERYAPDYPTALPQPDGFGDADVTLERAGLRLGLHVLGPGCSGAHVALSWEGHLFAGDLVANGTHSWLELGLSGEWLQRVEELAALGPTHVHPGRGDSAGPELLVAQREYLQRVRTLVAAEHAEVTAGGATPSKDEVDAALTRLRAALEREYPEHRFAVFLRIGLPAEWRRVAGEGQRSTTRCSKNASGQPC
ncbi:MBL fold metallo-hydrolase [Paraliomyxa miuraensis]|uniref:MBL fold metallo-hydrolase n=1 Tax=Paraliomyxa miuraensis TaxID=376150 RepID=UPI00224FA1FA|nr:MBL fold metallo-hydrolase [Paraliomyxa miuraensis]MCX4244296.1 MBL fold metallo-hydrolase [Paraliomyxa miuraensis]